MIVEIDISDLHAGHFVVDIVKQEGNYTLTTAARVPSASVIKRLKSHGVHSLLVDSNRSNLPQSIKQAKKLSPPAIIIETKKAKQLFFQAKEIQKKVFNNAYQGEPLDITDILDATHKTIAAIEKNPNAMACVINIRQKDDYLFEHSVSVSVLMTMFAHFMRMDRQIIELLSVGAFLHDIGKIKIPDAILNKTTGLTYKELEVMKSHVIHSIDIVSNIPDIAELSIEVVALHHERLNGSGYPFELHSDQISRYGRMIAICDIYDALTASRCYKKRFTPIAAFNVLRRLARENQLDTLLVDLFIKCMGVYPVGTLVELASHKLAIVEAKNELDPINPKVRSFYNIKDECFIMTEDIDLSRHNDFIVSNAKADDFDIDINKIIEFLLMEG